MRCRIRHATRSFASLPCSATITASETGRQSMALNLSVILPNVSQSLNGTGFLFGAGASREAGYPMMPALTREVVKALSAADRAVLEEVLKAAREPCLRISNPDDQSYVKNLLPDSVRGITSMFSTLRRGECILLGDSVMMPTRIKIDRPNPQPHSDDASFYKAWNEDPKDVDFAKVLNSWRNQEVVPRQP